MAQLILERISLPVVQEVEHFAGTLRDGKGFGSSGTASVRSQRHQERCQLCKLHSVTADELPLKNGINKDELEAGSSPFEVELNDCTCQEEAASNVGSEDVGSEGTAATCTSQPPDCFAGGWGYEREYESPPPPPPALDPPHSTRQLRSSAPPLTDVLRLAPPEIVLTGPEGKEVQYLVRRLRYHDELTRMQPLVARKRVAHRLLHSRRQRQKSRLRPDIFRSLVHWAQECPQVDVFASPETRHVRRFWHRHQDRPRAESWGDKFLFVHNPPHSRYKDVVAKIVGDGARGIAILPVDKAQSWFWALGETAVD